MSKSDHVSAAGTLFGRQPVAVNSTAVNVFCFPSHTRVPFFSQEIFFNQRKIKFNFFLVDFKADFYSQARWRGRNKAHVNKL
ncbi:MAG: hypothetical protein DMF31_05170 [Verrucomicrobia bacterium]|nr:MAG: hypothetical protein DME48_09950 [Verrucomicrobiota bacterium]PYL60171.1 MAG: hypothetical protein DMF31_05170 [Verrucomicrobiota bacterium]